MKCSFMSEQTRINKSNAISSPPSPAPRVRRRRTRAALCFYATRVPTYVPIRVRCVARGLREHTGRFNFTPSLSGAQLMISTQSPFSLPSHPNPSRHPEVITKLLESRTAPDGVGV
ncbi:hypothetical protein EVAR_72176_1 [Eumeta japonica]|uniref:Uncharacterized protein n=1 Tax=Eumeta variegata TaxID=151549 RepID=A0A4C1T0X0_EUMVA|nr:hypothetical protein EVAR_72176_1 [Eumeta japonica]